MNSIWYHLQQGTRMRAIVILADLVGPESMFLTSIGHRSVGLVAQQISGSVRISSFAS